MQDVKSIEYLKDTFHIGYNAYESSRNEAEEVWEMFHNRQYNSQELNVLRERGQPAETFNVLKVFTRMILGYYSTVINNISASPVSVEDTVTSAVLNDIISHVLRVNQFTSEGDKLKLSGLITGLMCAEISVVDTEETDRFGRVVKQIKLRHVPSREVVLDASSELDDYSDARYIHRFKWISEESVIATYGKEAVAKLQEHFNFTGQADADYSINGREIENGIYQVHDNYLIIHSVTKSADGKVWSTYWSDDVILAQEEITHAEVTFPYRVTKIHVSDDREYYGIYREVIQTQKAINQALTKLQQIINTQKALVEDGAVDDMDQFEIAFNRVSGVIPVKDLQGIKIETMSREAQELYIVIDKAFDRIQRVLGINDSFLGMAFASDSGRKVKLQQNASITALHYLTARIELFYRLVGWDVANLVKQYYKANQILRITDSASGDRFTEINKPMEVFTGQLDQNTGEPIMQIQYEEVLDPATGKPVADADGNMTVAPIPEPDTDMEFTKVEIIIESTAYNDEDEKNQLMLEQVLAGSVGQMLAQVNPAGYFKVAGLSMKSMKTKNALEIASVFAETSNMLGGNQQAQQQASEASQNQPQQGGSSAQLKLPQNTNEQG